MISKRISDNIPPQMKILNILIPILMHLYSLVSNWSVASCIKLHKGVRHQMKLDVINDVKLFPTVYCRIYCRKFLTLSNQTSRYKASALEYSIYLYIFQKQNHHKMSGVKNLMLDKSVHFEFQT